MKSKVRTKSPICLTIDSKILKEFREEAELRAINVSQFIEIFIKKRLKEWAKETKKENS